MSKETEVAKEVAEGEQVQVDMVSIPVQVLNETLKYLADKPYKEVFKIINAIQTESKDI
tara:strand:+ start:261 stop:437 length:177 start_codon:yes stop_codon:yes gene_type:complete